MTTTCDDERRTTRTRTVVAVVMLGVCALLVLYATQPVLADIARDLGVGTTAGAWTISATTLGVALTAPLAGSISDRLGRKTVMLVAIAVLALATLACAVAPTFALLLTFRGLEGTAVPFVFAVAVAYVAEELPAPAAARVNALYVSGTAFGGFLGRFLAGLAATHGGWRMAFAALFVVIVATFGVVALWLPPERRFTPASSLIGGVRDLGRHLHDPRLLGTAAVGAALLFLQVGAFTYAGLHLEAPPFGLDELAIGAVFGVFLVAVVVTPAAGLMIGALGHRATFAAAGGLAIAGLACTLADHVWTIVLGLALSATAVFAGQTCATGAAAEVRTARSAAVGLYLTGYYLGGSIGGVAPAPVFSAAGWPGVAALLAVVTIAAVGVAMVAFRCLSSERAGSSGDIGRGPAGE